MSACLLPWQLNLEERKKNAERVLSEIQMIDVIGRGNGHMGERERENAERGCCLKFR
jgi:hypothetical protein